LSPSLSLLQRGRLCFVVAGLRAALCGRSLAWRRWWRGRVPSGTRSCPPSPGGTPRSTTSPSPSNPACSLSSWSLCRRSRPPTAPSWRSS
ncbi:hypothetical protein AAFF_G00398160, partial [Aldrovandia affinis]